MKVRFNAIRRNKVPLWVFHGIVSATVLISAIVGVICVVFSKDELYDNELFPHQYKYLKYLMSLWISTFAGITFILYSAIDFSIIHSKKSKKWLKLTNILHILASYLLFSIVFPVSLMVSIIFWGFYFWNRDLVYPKQLDEVFPTLLNHMMHTFPALAAVAYMVTSNKYHPPRSKTLAVLMTILAVYFSCVIHIKNRDGKWIYYALEQIKPIYVQCLFVFIIIGCQLFLFLGHYLSNTLKPLRRYLPLK